MGGGAAPLTLPVQLPTSLYFYNRLAKHSNADSETIYVAELLIYMLVDLRGNLFTCYEVYMGFIDLIRSNVIGQNLQPWYKIQYRPAEM